jgi:hypothetical protein
MREPGPDPYRVLGVSRDATAADITRAAVTAPAGLVHWYLSVPVRALW